MERTCCHRDAFSVILTVAMGCAFIFLIAGDTMIISKESVIQFATLWLCSLCCGYIFQVVKIALLGSLISGIILKNLFDINVAPRFGEDIRTIGLCSILLMSSVEIDINKVYQAGMISMRLTLLPGIVEAITCGALSVWIFNMQVMLALSLGFILAAVSPAIVVPGMIQLRRLGFGVEKGIPSMLMAAASFDDIVAITGFTICIGIATDIESGNWALSALIHGPAQIILGVASGMVGGIVLAWTRFCSSKWQPTVIALELSLCITYLCNQFHMDGSGSIATLMMGIVAKRIWQQKSFDDLAKRKWSLPELNNAEYLRKVGRDIGILWEIVVQPLLFGSIGAAFDMDIVQKTTIMKSCAVVIIGSSIRVLVAYFSAAGRNLTTTERFFIGIAWLPKATVQAALCTLPLALIQSKMNTRENYKEQLVWGQQIISTAIMAIMITAPLGLISIQYFAPRLLTKENKLESNTMSPCQENTTLP